MSRCIACLFAPWGIAAAGAGAAGARGRRRRLCRQARRRRLPAGAVRDLDRQDARVPRAGIPRRRADARPAGDAAALRVAGASDEQDRFRHRPSARRLAGADQLHRALSGPALRAAQRLCRARAGAGGLGRLAGLHPGRAASLRHRGDRARLQGDRHPGGAASDHRAARHPSRDREGRRRRPDHARRHGPGRAVHGGHAARDRTAPIRWRARISPSRCRWCCSAC